jgi:hypothetical protein
MPWRLARQRDQGGKRHGYLGGEPQYLVVAFVPTVERGSGAVAGLLVDENADARWGGRAVRIELST